MAGSMKGVTVSARVPFSDGLDAEAVSAWCQPYME